MGRDPNADDPPSKVPDYEAARLRARMRANVFNLPQETVKIDRFEIVRRLGAGAMGLVYEVVDPRTGEHLALKTIRTHNPRAITLFKKEFRALARVTHPNLVTLYELGRDGGSYFFTMELIRGHTLLRHLWGSDEVEPPREAYPPSPVIDFDRLRDAFSQLAAAVAALHDAGKLHRDLKPSNVMVTPEGRVVVMDFGFVTEQGVAMLESTQGSLVVGTPAFMPPEQSRAERLGAEADWYSVGVTLYLALTGQLPFGGLPLAELLLIKEHQPPPQPRTLARGVPGDLAELCLALLHPRPDARPPEAEILQRLRAAPWGHTAAGRRARLQREALRRRSLVGQGDLFARLGAIVQGGEGLRVCEIRGRAGLGKTTLVSHVLEAVRAEGARAIILRARCNARDAVPVQAIDGLVDALARTLRQLAPAELAEVLPAETGPLVALFPVLAQVPALAAARGPVRGPEGVEEEGFRALRGLLARLAARRPLVLWIDDLQWSDLEGARRLHDLLAPPDAPPLAAILSYRSEDADESPAIAAVIAGLAPESLTLEPLGGDAAVSLASELLVDRPASEAAWIADEAAGSPQWIHELARLAGEGATRPTIAALVERRMGELSPAAASLVRLAAVAPRPLAVAVAVAAGTHEQALHAGLRQAIGAHLLRTVTGADGEAITPFDARVRGAVLALQDARALREAHRSLAGALERVGPRAEGWVEGLIHHLRGAGDLDRAQQHALTFADQRLHAGDHLGGAALLRLAQELGQEDAAGAALHRRIGDALAEAGHEIAAAEAWMQASALGLDRDDALALEIQAARAFLTHGHVDVGLRLLGAILRELHLPAIDEPMGRLSGLLRRGQLRLLGLRYRERPASAIPRRELLACDASFTASVGLWVSRPALAAAAQVRHLALTLRVGEAARIGRAVALEALRLADRGAELGRAREMQALAAELGQRGDDPHLPALAALAEATLALQSGDLAGARAAAERAQGRLGGPGGATWERLRAHLVIAQCDTLTGDLAAGAERAAAVAREAEALRSPATAALFAHLSARFRIAAGDLAGAAAALQRGGDAIPGALGVAGWVQAAAAAEHALLRGDPTAAASAAARVGGATAESLLGALAIDLRARAALWVGDPERLRQAERDLQALRRSPLPAASALAAALAASLAAFTGDRGAARLLDPAADRLDAAGLHLRAAALRARARRLPGTAAASPPGPAIRGPVDLAALAAVHCPWPAPPP